MIYYAVIDTNVLVSSLLTKHNDSATVQVVSKILNGEVVAVYSKDIIEEYKVVLHREKFKFDKELVNTLILAIQQLGILIDPIPTEEMLPDIKDLPFYEVVDEIKNEGGHLITGNLKHFPSKPYIVTASQFLEIINNK